METATASRRFFDWRILVIGGAGGFLGGFFGVGGGILLVPLIMWLLAPPRRVAHATSLGAIIALATSGMLGFAVEGRVNWGVGVSIGIGGVVGAAIGASLMNRLSPDVLRTIFAVVLVVAGVRMVL